MRIKGISWIEQHFEKIIAGVFGASMLGVLAWQFLSPEPTVKLGQKDVRIHSGYDELNEFALRVQGRINAQDVKPPDGLAALVGPLENYQQALGGAVAPTPALPGVLGNPVKIDAVALSPGGSGQGAAPGVARLGLPTLPGPENPVAATYLATIHPLEIKRAPALAEFLRSDGPTDAASVTVEATVSGAALKAALATDPDGDGPLAPLRTDLWDGPGRLQLLAVELERETLGPDGTWGNATTVRPMPGRFSLHEALAKPVPGVQGMRELMDQATRNAEQVRRPPFLAIFQGQDWTPPSERTEVESGDTARQIDLARRSFVNLQRERERLERERDSGGRPGGDGGRDPAPRQPPGGGGGAGGAGGGGKPGGGGGERTPPRNPPSAPNPAGEETRIRNLNQRIQRIVAEQDGLIRRLKALGDDTRDLRPEEAENPDQPGRQTADAAALLEAGSIQIWAHDVSVERGKTYRYRVRLVLNNPLFQQLALLDADQAALASVPAVKTEPSAWTSPVGVEAEQYVYVTAANLSETGLITRAAGARAEVYVFRWGFWRKAEVQLEPGDRVETDVRSPDFTAAFRAILDAADRPDGGRDGTGGGPQASNEPPPIVSVPVRSDSTLLNVASDQAPTAPNAQGESVRLVAYVRSPDGRIEPRRPEAELQSAMLRALRASAEQGERATRPRIGLPAPGEGPAPGDPQRDPRQPQTPTAPIGPGGGGLGGG